MRRRKSFTPKVRVWWWGPLTLLVDVFSGLVAMLALSS
jgi:hypothetical protein